MLVKGEGQEAGAEAPVEAVEPKPFETPEPKPVEAPAAEEGGAE